MVAIKILSADGGVGVGGEGNLMHFGRVTTNQTSFALAFCKIRLRHMASSA